MKKQFRPLWWLSALAFVLSVGLALNAQQTTPQQGQSTGQQAQPPAAPPAAQTPAPPTSDEPAPPPSAQSPAAPAGGNAPPSSATPSTGTAGQPSQANGVQAFSGTIVKIGDRYMLHDEATGQTYDLDHQDEVQKYAGKRVRVHGTLDPTGKMIHLQ
jgi:Protein of unknown function (DUF5818)